jgi:hypothetical protein
MNVFDLAMEMEKDGEKYYRHLAEKTTNTGMKNILNLLAGDEAKHFQVLQKLKSSARTELLSTPILSKSKNIFQMLREEKNWTDLPTSQIDLYKKAREIEILHGQSQGKQRSRCQENVFSDSRRGKTPRIPARPYPAVRVPAANVAGKRRIQPPGSVLTATELDGLIQRPIFSESGTLKPAHFTRGCWYTG